MDNTNSTAAKRLREIIRVLTKYNVIESLSKQTHPEHVRLAFEELGSSFIKIGQALSMRPDIVSQKFADEFKKLQCEVKADSFDVMRPLIEESIGMPIEELFGHFDENPIASASIAQVYRAELKGRQPIIIKVQHPGVREKLEIDISLLEKSIPLIKRVPTGKLVEPSEIVSELKRSLLKELDFLNEIENIEKFYAMNSGCRGMICARAYSEFSSPTLLVMDYLDGVMVRDFLLSSSPARKAELARNLLDNYLKQIFEDGFFHADPHPANILIKSVGGVDNISYIDFGMMGNLSASLMQKFNALLIAISSQDSDKIAAQLLRICSKRGPVDMDAFSREVGLLFGEYYGKSIEDLNIPEAFGEITRICESFGLIIPKDIALLFKGIITIEGIAQELAPELSLMKIIDQYVSKRISSKFASEFDLSGDLRSYLFSLYELSKTAPKLPSKLLDLIARASEGRLKVGLDSRNLDDFARLVFYSVNRLTAGIVLAALIIGSSMLMSSTQGPARFSFGVAGYIISFVIAVVLIVSSFGNSKK